MKLCLLAFRCGKIVMLLEAAPSDFRQAVRLWFSENMHNPEYSLASGDEFWIVHADAFHEARELYAGDVKRQREAIKTADGAIEAQQYLRYKEG